MRDSSIARRLASQMWGPDVQRQKKLAPGIWWFTTAGHGGLIVDTEIRSELAEFQTTVFIRSNSCFYLSSEQHFAAFEEDCMAPIVEWQYATEIITPCFMKSFATPEGTCFQDWKAQRLDLLKRSLQQWHPEWIAKNMRDCKGEQQ